MNINKNQIILGVVILSIVGGIFYLESVKVSRSGSGTSLEGGTDIDIEELVLGGLSDAEEGNSPEEGEGNEIAEVIIETSETRGMVEPNLSKISAEERIASKKELFEVAKEISTPDGFINVDSITISEFIGKKIILVDFWTYSCINCQRTLPFLNSWNEKYNDKGLVILGIHTPEFEFEKDYENVLRAVEKFGVTYPVILDNDFSTWVSYRNRYWPRKYLIDIDGFIVYDHIGEGAYEETEKKIVELLNERSRILGGEAVSQDMAQPESVDEVNFQQVRTPELYLGSLRIQYLANLPSQECFEKMCEFKASGGVALNTYEISGTWTINPEESTLESNKGSLFIRFSANKVNLVAGVKEGNVRAEVYLDGELVNASNSGLDVANGIVTFSTDDLYNLVDLKGNYGEHMLEIRFLNEGIEAFAFTFG